jgi:hypothetical protein
MGLALGGGFWDDEDVGPNPRLTRLTALTQDVFGKTNEEVAAQPETSGGKKALAAIRSKMKTLSRAGEQQKARQEVHLKLLALAEGGAIDLEELAKALKTMARTTTFRQFIEFLGTLTISDRQEIHRALASRRQREPGCENIIQGIHYAVEQSLAEVNPALLPSLQATLADAIRNASCDKYMEAIGQASEVFPNRLGHSECHLIAMDAIAYLLQTKTVGLDEVEAFFANVVPGPELAAIISDAAPYARGMSEHVQAMTKAQACLDSRRTDANQKYTAAMNDLKQTPFVDEGEAAHRVRDPEDYANSVIAAAKLFEEFQTYAGAAQDIQESRVSASSQQLKEHRAALVFLNFPVNLVGLDELVLKDLEVAVRALGVPEFGHAIDSARTSKAKKREDAHLAISARAIRVLRGIGTPGGPTLADALRTIRDAKAEHARSSFARKRPFEAELKEQIGHMPAASRRALGQALRTREMRELSAALREVGRTAVIKEYDPLPHQLYELESVLAAARAAVDPAGAAAGDEAVRIPQLGALSEEVRNAMRVCGSIEIGTNGAVYVTSGLAPKYMQAAVQAHLVNTTAPGGDETVGQDLGMLTSYAIDGKPIVNKAKYEGRSEQGREQLLFDALEHLQIWCGKNPKMFGTLRTVASMDAMAVLTKALASVDSPIRMPDGTPLQLLSEIKPSFNIRPDGRGGLIVSCRLRLPKTERGMVTDATGRVRPIEMEQPLRAEVNYDVAISPEGRATMAGPVEFFWGPLAPDVTELTHANANRYLVNELLEYLHGEFSAENLLFILDLNEFDKLERIADALPKARAIVAQFVSQSSATQVNLPNDIRQRLEQAVVEASNEVDEAKARGTLTRAFDEGRHAINQLLKRDTYPRFLKLESSEAPAPAKAAPPVVEEAPAPDSPREASPERDARWQSIRTDLVFLAAVLPSDRLARTYVSSLRDHDGHLGNDKDSADVRRRFRQQVAACLDAFPPRSAASLIYNIDNLLPLDLQGAWDVVLVREAAIQALKGKREGRMTPEGVLLEASPESVNMSLLSTWFAARRINEEEVASHFQKLQAARLFNLTSSVDLDADLLRIAQAVLQARREQVEALGGQLLDESTDLIAALRIQDRRLQPDEAAHANSLAERLQRYEELSEALRMRSSPVRQTLRASAAQLATLLTELGRTPGPGLPARSEPEAPLPPPPDDEPPPPPPDDPAA